MTRMTFGFKNLNGQAFQIKLEKTPTGRMPSAKTINGIRKHVLREMNRAGRQAAKIAKQPGHSPYLTGALVRSIKWNKAQEGRIAGRFVRGSLSVSVPYGRRQEFEHRSRGRYLQRAMEAVQPEYLRRLRDRRVFGDVLFGRRRQIGDRDAGVRGGFF